MNFSEANNTTVDLEAAVAFLKLLDANDRYTFQTFEDKKPPMQRDLAKIVHSPKAADRLKTLHRLGAGIYITVNETDLKGRTVENIKRVRAVWQEDDDGYDGTFPLAPSMIVETSPGHRHRYWFVADEWPADEQGRADFAAVMDRMVLSYGSDKNAKDVSRVLLFQGFCIARPIRSWSGSLKRTDGATPAPISLRHSQRSSASRRRTKNGNHKATKISAFAVP